MSQHDPIAELIEALAEATSALGLVEAQRGLNPILQRARDRGKSALKNAPQMWEETCPTCKQSNRALLCSDGFHAPLNAKADAERLAEVLERSQLGLTVLANMLKRVSLERGEQIAVGMHRDNTQALATYREKHNG